MVTNQNGIAHLGIIILGALVISGIGFAGYKVYAGSHEAENRRKAVVSSNTHSAPRPTASDSKIEVSTKKDEPTAKADTWLSYKNDDMALSFEYPESWQISGEALPCVRNVHSATGQECGVSIAYKQSNSKYPPTISFERLAISLTEAEAWYDNYYAQSVLNESTKARFEIKGKQAISYIVSNSGNLSKLYLIESNSRVYVIETVDSYEAHQLKEYIPTFDKVFDSLKISN